MVVLGKRMKARKTGLMLGETLAGQRDRLNELLRHPLRGQDSAAFLDSSGATLVSYQQTGDQ